MLIVTFIIPRDIVPIPSSSRWASAISSLDSLPLEPRQIAYHLPATRPLLHHKQRSQKSRRPPPPSIDHTPMPQCILNHAVQYLNHGSPALSACLGTSVSLPLALPILCASEAQNLYQVSPVPAVLGISHFGQPGPPPAPTYDRLDPPARPPAI